MDRPRLTPSPSSSTIKHQHAVTVELYILKGGQERVVFVPNEWAAMMPPWNSRSRRVYKRVARAVLKAGWIRVRRE